MTDWLCERPIDKQHLFGILSEKRARPGSTCRCSLTMCILGGIMAKVLVIDDEQGIRSLLGTLLSRKGYAVVLADGGRKGLELFRLERPDVVVLDLKMSGMYGVTVLRQIR